LAAQENSPAKNELLFSRSTATHEKENFSFSWSEGEGGWGWFLSLWVMGCCGSQCSAKKEDKHQQAQLAPQFISLLRKEKTNHQLWAELRAQQLIGLFFAVGEREGKSTLPSFLHLFFSADGAEEKREEKREERRVAGRFALLHSNQRFPFRLGLPKPNPTTL